MEAGWPCNKAMVNSDAVAIAKLTLLSASADAPYIGLDHDEGEQPDPQDVAFWKRVAAERSRIAQWVVDGLGISGRAEKVES